MTHNFRRAVGATHFGLVLFTSLAKAVRQTSLAKAVRKTTALIFVAACASGTCSAEAASFDSLRTLAERSNYTETPRYPETKRYFESLDRASERAKLISFGTSPQGRDQFAFVIASGGEFTPELAAASNKPVLMIQACIHAGENEGKDALMALSREWLVGNQQRVELDQVILLLLPIFNVDGHERFSEFNRINQNGPKAMGYRTTAQNLNLNRDFVKAEAPEMQAWHGLWNRWNPSLLIDMHNTDGADYQYHLLLHYENHAAVAPSIRAWQTLWPDVVKATEAKGFLLAPYLDMKVFDDLKQGLQNSYSGPRFSAGFGVITQRPALLLETHMMKDFKTRVRVNQAFLRATVAQIAAAPEQLMAAVKQADQAAQDAAEKPYTLQMELSERTEDFQFKGYAYRRIPSEISGGLWTQYDTAKPETWTIPLQNTLKAKTTVTLPSAYLVPKQWQSAIAQLRLHGVEMEPLKHPLDLQAAHSYRFKDVSYQRGAFEGMVRLATLETEASIQALQFEAGSMLVRVNQRHSGKLAHLLEPLAPDSLVRDGYGNFFLSRAEYAEPRVLERKAREMLSADPALRAEFERKLADDPLFAASSAARLEFFYRKLPYYDQRYLVYPVARLSAEQLRVITANNTEKVP